MRNKRRVAIALYHRNKLSLGESRVALGHGAYHWGVIVMPKPERRANLRPSATVVSTDNQPLCDAFDATDAIVMDPETGRNLNPSLDWYFRAQHGIDPFANGRLIGRVIVGKVPKHFSDSTIDSLLANIALPVKDASPRQNCVSWTLDALSSLQAAGIARTFDVDQFKTWALAYADECMANLGSNNVCEYPQH